MKKRLFSIALLAVVCLAAIAFGINSRRAAVEVTAPSGTELSAFMTQLVADNPEADSYVIMLEANGVYTVEASIVSDRAVSLVGDAAAPASIDASALESPLIQMSNTPYEPFLNEQEFYNIGNIRIANVAVKGLARQLFYANATKYLIGELALDNSILEIAGGNKNVFDTQGGGVIGKLSVTNSTIYGNPAHTGALYSSQSGQKATDAGLEKQTLSLQNSTLYNIALDKNVCSHRQSGQKWLAFDVQQSLIVDCGKSGQFVRGLNQGQASANPVWTVSGNSFQRTVDGVLTDVSADESTGDDEEPVSDNVEGVVAFAGDIATGDFTLGNCPQNDAKIGDPRWLVEIIGDPITLALTGGADISSALDAALAENAKPQSVTITLGVGNYTVSSPLEVSCPITIEGDASGPVRIDASALEAPMIQLGKEGYSSTLNEQGFYAIGGVRIANVSVKYLARQLFYANGTKYLIDELSLENSVVGISGGNKNVFDTQGGGVIGKLSVTNSTIYGNPAHTGALYSSQSGQKATDAGLEKQTLSLQNSTLYNIALDKNVCSHRQSGQKWLAFDVQQSLIVDCGKSGQFVRGLNQGQASANPVWTVSGNSFQRTVDGVLTDVSADESTGDDEEPVSDNVEGVVAFAGDIATGDFTLGNCPQNDAKIGDPRWLVEIIGDPITLALTGGADISSALDAALAENVNPQSVTITLGVGNYTVSSPLEVSCPLTIEGDASGPVSIDASALEAPMIQLGGKEGYSSTLNEQGFYAIGNVRIANVAVKGLARQLFYANSTKYLIDELSLENSVVGISGGNKNVFDTQGGGVIGKLSVTNSTIYGNPAHTGALYSSQSGQKATDAGLEKQTLSLQNSTLYNIALDKNVCSHRQAGQKWLEFVVQSCLIVDCGKSGQFVKGLNNGQASANPVWNVVGNSFQRTVDGVLTDIAASEETGDEEEPVKDNVEGVVVFAGDIATGDFTLGDCPQNDAKVGDPRWLVELIGEPIVLTPESGSDLTAVLNEALATNGKPQSVTITLAADAAYTVSGPLAFSCPVTIEGDASAPATIDASALSEPFILMNKEGYTSTLNEQEFYDIGNVRIANVAVKGLARQLFYANGTKYLIGELALDNSIVEIAGGNKNVFDTQGGGVIGKLSVTNSTIYGNPAHTGALYSSQSGQKATDAGLEKQTLSLQNSTLYNIALDKNVCSHRQAGQKWLEFVVQSCLIVDCGKSGQFVKGLNNGQASANPVWNVVGNSFQRTVDGVLTDIAASEETGDEEEPVKDNVEGVVVFAADVATGDFTLGDCPQNDAKVGDPRWLTEKAFTEPIDIFVESGGDIAAALNSELLTSNNPESITIRLASGGNYKLSQSINVANQITILGDAAGIAEIDATELNGPVINMDQPNDSWLNELEFYEIGDVTVANVKINGLKNQLFYANKNKFLIGQFSIQNSIIHMDGGNKTLIDTNGGGVIGKLSVTNSTIYGNPAHTGALYSSQSGQKATDAGLEKQTLSLQNSTLYNIALDKNVCSHRQAGQKWLEFVVQSCLIVDCGKSGQFVKGLNNGQASANPVWNVVGNSFQRTVDGALTDTAASEETGDEEDPVKDNVEGVAVFAADVAAGDFTLGNCPQNTANIGDPRWLNPDAIINVTTENADGYWYNINGQRVVSHSQKGIYIHNGKKVVVK